MSIKYVSVLYCSLLNSSDRLVSQYGKRRPLMLGGTVLLWYVESDWSESKFFLQYHDTHTYYGDIALWGELALILILKL